MTTYATKFGISDTAYYIKDSNLIQVVITDVYVHETIAAFTTPLISYKVTYPATSAGVGTAISGKTLFFESDLMYLTEAQATMTQILATKAAAIQGLQ